MTEVVESLCMNSYSLEVIEAFSLHGLRSSETSCVVHIFFLIGLWKDITWFRLWVWISNILIYSDKKTAVISCSSKHLLEFFFTMSRQSIFLVCGALNLKKKEFIKN